MLEHLVTLVRVKKSRLIALIVLSCVLFQFESSAVQVIRSAKLLTLGCYRYTDILKNSSSTNNGTQTSNQLGAQVSDLPEAYLGKELLEVDCGTKHHVEISLIGKLPIKGTIKLDTVTIRSRCLIHNIANVEKGHVNHSSQLFVNVWRTGKTNSFNCGVVGASSTVPTAPGYRIFQAFYSPVLKQGA